jgi:GABA(A) receptor-associated protein
MFQNIFNKVSENTAEISSTIKNNDVKKNLDDYPYIKKFKQQKLEFRLQASNKILIKYKERVPIIADCKNDIIINKNKYLVPIELSIGQFLYILKKRMNINSKQAIFLLCNNQLLTNTDTIQNAYNKFKDEDGFLYIYISLENTFG